MVPISLSLLAILSIIGLLGFEHYVPYRRLLPLRPGERFALPRLAAYVLGVVAVVVPWSLWTLAYPEITPLLAVLGLVLAFLIGGLTVTGLWAIDGLLKGREARATAAHLEQKIGRNDG